MFKKVAVCIIVLLICNQTHSSDQRQLDCFTKLASDHSRLSFTDPRLNTLMLDPSKPLMDQWRAIQNYRDILTCSVKLHTPYGTFTILEERLHDYPEYMGLEDPRVPTQYKKIIEHTLNTSNLLVAALCRRSAHAHSIDQAVKILHNNFDKRITESRSW